MGNFKTSRARALGLVSFALLFSVGCDPSVFQFGADVDIDGRDGGGNNGEDLDARVDAPVPDADLSPDACVPSNEVCDNVDNDCDLNIDEGIDLTSDPNNCGACGETCNLLQFHALGSCQASQCEFVCQGGFLDLDNDLDTDPTDPDFNGCEYQCIPTNNGVEACDFVDNDCNGQIDETFNLDSDLNNCGGCGVTCQALNATAECSAGECGFSECDPGFLDRDNNEKNGCEYVCPVFSGTTCTGDGDCSGTEECRNGFCIEPEICNGVDDDCDGVVDNQPIAGEGATCDPFGTGDVGECSTGQNLCSFGVVLCQGAVGPQTDICDGLDNDCDGTPDQDFDKDNDPTNCGSCGFVCQDQPGFDNVAIPNCTNGVCGIVACDEDFFNLDGDDSNGCEFFCAPVNPGPEVCDGEDNDCDGLVDIDDPDIILVNNFCRTAGECAGTVPTCTAGICDTTIDWRCVYDDVNTAVELDACGDPVAQEATCDDLDNDCDNATDEASQFSQKGAVCKEDGTFGTTAEQGICQGTGLIDCNGAGTGLVCNIDDPGGTSLGFEECDGEDDDCDGLIDEAADLDLDLVTVTDGVVTFSMFQHEASRPDASATSSGAISTNPAGGSAAACSTPGVLPWVTVTKGDAEAACVAAGGRLCTEAEWELACAGTAGHLYPYNTSIQGCLEGPNAGDLCTADIDCEGECIDGDPNTQGNACTLDSQCDNVCAGGDNEGTACTDDTPCTGGGFCDIGTCALFTCGDVYVPDACNGRDFDPNEDAAIPTGDAAVCESEFSAFDLSGNVKEWTSTEVTAGTFRVRGGSFDNVEEGLTCEFDFVAFNQDIAFPNLGFRCCID